jgi:hypothetical protein
LNAIAARPKGKWGVVLADNNRGKSPGTAEASRQRAKSPDWSLADVNASRQEHAHLTGCQHIQEGVYVVVSYTSGRKAGLAKVALRLDDEMFAIRRVYSDRIFSLPRRQLRIPDAEELGALSQAVPVPARCGAR